MTNRTAILPTVFLLLLAGRTEGQDWLADGWGGTSTQRRLEPRQALEPISRGLQTLRAAQSATRGLHQLAFDGTSRSLRAWGEALLQGMQGVSESHLSATFPGWELESIAVKCGLMRHRKMAAVNGLMHRVNRRDQHGWLPVHYAALAGNLAAMQELYPLVQERQYLTWDQWNSRRHEKVTRNSGCVDRSDRSGVAWIEELRRQSFRDAEEMDRRMRRFTGLDSYGGASSSPWGAFESGASGASLTDPPPGQVTPLHVAALAGKLEVVQLLCPQPVRDEPIPESPYDWVIEEQRRKNAELSITPDVVDLLGRTPLAYAVAGGHRAVAAWLLVRGADPKARDANGVSPADLLPEKGVDFVEWCQQFDLSGDQSAPRGGY